MSSSTAYYRPALRNYRIWRECNREEEELPWIRPCDASSLWLRRPVVLVNGCFDLLHSGHMKVLFIARKVAGEGTVVVAIDSDERIKELKGPSRPIQTLVERATALNYMPIDYLCEFSTQEELKMLVEGISPNVRVQGGDHSTHPSTFPSIPKIYVPSRGMHTSLIIERCRTTGVA